MVLEARRTRSASQPLPLANRENQSRIAEKATITPGRIRPEGIVNSRNGGTPHTWAQRRLVAEVPGAQWCVRSIGADFPGAGVGTRGDDLLQRSPAI